MVRLKAAALFVLMVLCVSGYAGAARASFLEPRDCRTLSAEELFAKADIVFSGRLERSSCQCSFMRSGVTCTDSLAVLRPLKGNVPQGQMVLKKKLMLDHGLNEAYCKQIEKETVTGNGTVKDYYITTQNGEYREVSPRECGGK